MNKIKTNFSKIISFFLKLIPLPIRKFLSRIISLFFKFGVLDISAQSAYYWVFSFFPFVFCILLVISNLNIDTSSVDQNIINAIPSYLLPLFENLKSGLDEVGAPIFSISFILLFVSASSATTVLVKNIRIIFDSSSKRNYFIERGLSFGFNILFIIVTFSSILFYLFISHIISFLNSVIGIDLSKIISFIAYLIIPLSIFILLIILNFLAVPKIKLRSTIWGSLSSTIGFILFFKIINLYFSINNFYTSTYGIIGTFIILIIYFYFLSLIILTGSIINKVINEMKYKKGN